MNSYLCSVTPKLKDEGIEGAGWQFFTIFRLKEDSILYFLKGATYIFININWFQISVGIVKVNSANPKCGNCDKKDSF